MNRPIPNEPDDGDQAPARLPPFSTPAEEGLIGACLQGRAAIDAAREHTTPTDLHSTGLGEILHAILTIDTEGDKVDAFTVAAHLGTDTTERLGGLKKLTGLEMAGNVATAARHARTIADLAAKRRLHTALTKAAEQIIDGADLDPVVANVGDHLLTITTAGRRTSHSSEETAAAALAELEKRYEGTATIIPLPWPTVADIYGGGYRPGELHFIGARPGVGKTMTALAIATHAANAGHRVLYFSLEMTHVELGLRIVGATGGIHLNRLRTGNLHATDWDKVAAALAALPNTLTIDDNAGASLAHLTACARRYKPDLIVGDYLQLFATDGKSENRTQEVSTMTRGLKRLAGEMQCATLILSQLSRGVEQRMDRRPVLSDLRDSGTIEQDGDSVMFAWREKDDRDGIIRWEVAKQRSGPTGEFRMIADGAHGRITEAPAA